MSGRIRTIKPEVLDDEKASRLSDSAWRLWLSTWVLADDHGNARAGAKYLAARVWQDTSRSARAEKALLELVETGLVFLYESSGERFVHINGWSKHQRVDNAGRPRVPTPPTSNQAVAPILADSSASPRGSPDGSRKIPLARRARAQSGGETPTPIPTTTTDPDRVGGSVRVGMFGEDARVYAETVAKASGRPLARLPTFEAARVKDGIDAHCALPPSASVDEVLGWLRESVTRYVRVHEAVPSSVTYQVGYKPSKWVDWLNAGSRVPETRDSGAHAKAACYDEWKPPLADDDDRGAA